MGDDYMEMGDSGIVPLEDGWYLEVATGNKRDPQGRVWNSIGELLWDPNLEEKE